MRKPVYSFALLLVALFTAMPLSRAEAGPSSADRSKDLSVVALKDAPDFAKRALVIGIDHYLHVPKLEVCARDAQHFADLLKTKFGFTDVVVMTDEPGTADDLKPTYTNIKYQLRTLKDGVIGGQTEVVLFFSGHGTRTQGSESGDNDWLVPLDGDAADIPGTCINYTVFENSLETKKPARALLVMDACRNLEPGKGLDNGSGFGRAPKPLGPQIAQLLSCQPTEISREGLPGDFPESVFTHYLIAGLEGDSQAVAQGTNAVTFDSLMLYVQGAVSAYVRNHFKGAVQIPDGSAKQGWMVLARSAGVSIKPEDVVVASEDPIAHLKLAVPAGAKVTVDGKPQSGDDLQFDLGADKTRQVEVVVQLAGYKSKIAKVTLIRGAVEPLSIELEPLPDQVVPPAPSDSDIPAPVNPKTKINPIDGAEMILIPAGEFTMGSNDPESYMADSHPKRRATLDAYYINKNDVTVAQYKKFCEATSRTMPVAPSWGWDHEDYPMVNVSWDDAQAYVKWAGVALPTEAQWEKAARGGDGRTYPWGDTWDPAKCRCSSFSYGEVGSPSPVGSFPDGVSPYGVLDMAGNVEQWCDDFYENKSNHVVRGGGWVCFEVMDFRCACRLGYLPEVNKDYLGFRCVSRSGF